MAYFKGVNSEFEQAVNRGILHTRSNTLKLVITRIQEYQQRSDGPTLILLVEAFIAWQFRHPKEYISRMSSIETEVKFQLVNECRRLNLDRKSSNSYNPLRTYLSDYDDRGGKQHVVYSPFSVMDAQDIHGYQARLLGTSWEGINKYQVVRHRESSRVLSDVLPQTVVYVVAHCSRGSNQVQDNNHNALNFTQLANRIQADGLKLGHRVMKLYICEGALGDDSLPTDSPGSQSFAKKFLGAMRTIGYNDLELYAYCGSVSSVHPDDQHRYQSVKGAKNQKARRAHEIRVPVIG